MPPVREFKMHFGRSCDICGGENTNLTWHCDATVSIDAPGTISFCNATIALCTQCFLSRNNDTRTGTALIACSIECVAHHIILTGQSHTRWMFPKAEVENEAS